MTRITAFPGSSMKTLRRFGGKLMKRLAFALSMVLGAGGALAQGAPETIPGGEASRSSMAPSTTTTSGTKELT